MMAGIFEETIIVLSGRPDVRRNTWRFLAGYAAIKRHASRRAVQLTP